MNYDNYRKSSSPNKIYTVSEVAKLCPANANS